MGKITSRPLSDSVRQHAHDTYVEPARHRGERTIAINVGKVHKAIALRNRVPLVCQALESVKFLQSNKLKLVSRTGPPSGQSTTVTYTYEIMDADLPATSGENPWLRLRGALRDVFAELGGGEAYLRAERNNFYAPSSGSQDDK